MGQIENMYEFWEVCQLLSAMYKTTLLTEEPGCIFTLDHGADMLLECCIEPEGKAGQGSIYTTVLNND